MKTTFTPMHLSLLLGAYTGTPSTYPETPTKHQYTADLMRQGLVYGTFSELKATAYGARKVQELLLTLQLPGEMK